ncbi:MAG: hypothetical protein LC713_05015, partial [Actinobacteria bacterium]|nr:hypothetical protein [Actinomycetota bacterium]
NLTGSELGQVRRFVEQVLCVVGVLFTAANPAWGFAYAAVLSSAGAIVLADEPPGGTIVQRP